MSRGQPLIAWDACSLAEPEGTSASEFAASMIGALASKPGSFAYSAVSPRRPNARLPEGISLLGESSSLPRQLWIRSAFPRALKRAGTQLGHYLDPLLAIFSPIPCVLTLLDLSHVIFPAFRPFRSRLFRKRLLRLASRRAKIVLSPSQVGKEQILRALGVRSRKVRTIRPGVSPDFRRIAPGAELERVRRKYHLEEPFLLSVGSVERRKNFPLLMNAYSLLIHRGRREKLAFAGPFGFGHREALAEVAAWDLEKEVRFLGYVPREDLPALYSLSRAMVCLSAYESVGFPVLEAMACGTPVLASDRGALAEFGKDGALIMDPDNPEAIESGMRRLLTEEPLIERLRQAGIARASQFSWDQAAVETTAIYEEILRE